MNEEQFGEEVRRQGYDSDKSMYDLVYDEVSGEFKQVRRGASTNGSVVTEMTEQGFA
ncbi:MAG: hypothetical protein K2M55_03660 [Muribaculaceae bacterium]|nr:hypothetical protein [Muribaculaceae bacterium]